MAVSIEDILLMRSQQESQDDSNLSAIIGAGVGGTAGISLGQLSRRLNPTQQMIMPSSALGRVKPGVRMAGGLVGAVLGGALGAGAREAMIAESPAARMLAKIQTEGTLSYADQQQLQDILTDAYSKNIG